MLLTPTGKVHIFSVNRFKAIPVMYVLEPKSLSFVHITCTEALQLLKTMSCSKYWTGAGK